MKKLTLLPATFALSLCFTNGSAIATPTSDCVEVNQGEMYTQDIDIPGTAQNGSGIVNYGTIKNDHIIMNYAGEFNNTNGIIDTRFLDIYIKQGYNDVGGIEGKISASEAFIYRGTKQNAPELSLKALVDTPLLHIVGSPTNWVGLGIDSQAVIDKVDAIKVEGYGSRTKLYFKEGTFNYKGNISIVHHEEGEAARIQIAKDADVTLNSVTMENGSGLIQADDNSSIAVENLTVKDSANLNLSGWGTGDSSIHLNNVYLGKGAILTAMDQSPNGHNFDILGDISLTLNTDAVVDFVRPPLTGAQYESKEANLKADSLNVTVLDAHSDSQVLLSKENTNIESDKITVTGAPSSNTGNSAKDLEALGNTIKYATKADAEAKPELSDVIGFEVKQEANDLYDGASAVIGENGLENIQTHSNSNIYGIAEMNTLGLHIWRNEINDMNKRLGEIRDSKGQLNGVWARVYTGEAEIGSQSVTNEYQAVQFGYDRQISPNVFVGTAFSYTDGDNEFAVGGGENQIYALTAYGSYVADSGLFVDLTAKYGRLDNEFNIGLADGTRSTGNYDANAFSVSAEAGWRFNATDIFFVEPQVEMMYGWVEELDYTTSTGLSVEHDKAETLIGRAGFVLGLQCPDKRGNAYIRASVLHDFKGEADYAFTKNGDVRHLSDDLGGTWYEYGIGANFNVTPQTHVYADLEAANGGEVDTDYRVNLGLRYSF